METRHSICRNPLRSCEACARECRRTRASTRYSSDEPDLAARRRADRSEQRRMGHRTRMTRREPTQRPTGSSDACRPAGCLARSCHAGDASNAPVRAAGTHAGRSSERRPARRATSRRGAHFTPGAAKGRGIGRNGKRGRREQGQAVRAVRRRWRCGRDVAAMPVVPYRPLTSARSCADQATSNRSGNGGALPAHRPLAQKPCIVTVGSTTRCTTP